MLQRQYSNCKLSKFLVSVRARELPIRPFLCRVAAYRLCISLLLLVGIFIGVARLAEAQPANKGSQDELSPSTITKEAAITAKQSTSVPDVKTLDFMTHIWIRPKGWKGGGGIGSGALFSERWVITAKHVVKKFCDKPKEYTLTCKFQDGTRVDAIAGSYHPDCDLALLVLKKPVKRKVKLYLQKEDLKTGKTAGKNFPGLLTGAAGSFIVIPSEFHVWWSDTFADDNLRAGDSGSVFIYQTKQGENIGFGCLRGGHIVNGKKYAAGARFGLRSKWIQETFDRGNAWFHIRAKINWKNIEF